MTIWLLVGLQWFTLIALVVLAELHVRAHVERRLSRSTTAEFISVESRLTPRRS
jgi:hypothetical protein